MGSGGIEPPIRYSKLESLYLNHVMSCNAKFGFFLPIRVTSTTTLMIFITIVLKIWVVTIIVINEENTKTPTKDIPINKKIT